MKILKYAFHVTPAKRRVMAVLATVMTFTSSHVQAARASEVLPAPPARVVAATTVSGTTLERGIMLPMEGIPSNAPVTTQTDSPAPVSVAASDQKPAKPIKKVWNRVNAPDLVTKAAHSAEPALRTMVVPTTAYTSDPGETDSSPFTTANGTRVYDGVVAANFLQFGTRVRFPDQFGDKVFVVADRMNARYTQRVDIWMTNKADARTWGVRRVKIEILP